LVVPSSPTAKEWRVTVDRERVEEGIDRKCLWGGVVKHRDERDRAALFAARDSVCDRDIAQTMA